MCNGAEAFFGNRSEICVSCDGYANLEVEYLLLRFESFYGVFILTTNSSLKMDLAFLRHLRCIVEFPVPIDAQAVGQHTPGEHDILEGFFFDENNAFTRGYSSVN